jgi:hypothetical protein
MLTWASFVDKQWQVQLQYVRDLKVEEGPKVSGLQARLLYVYQDLTSPTLPPPARGSRHQP